MPLYEWRCAGGHVFEMLTRAGTANRRLSCPRCGAKAQRMISSFAIHAGAAIRTSAEKAAMRDVDVGDLKLPNAMRLCAMDDYSATRVAAHKLGRGDEFEDKMASRKERQAARGEPAKKTASRKSKHSHQH